MKTNNRKVNVALVILAILCVYQMFRISDLSNENTDLSHIIVTLQNRVNSLAYDVDEVNDKISQLDEETLKPTKKNYSVAGMDYEKGIIDVKIDVNVLNGQNVNKVIVSDENNDVTLDKEGNKYTGIIQYPMSEREMETVVYLYEDDNQIAGENMIIYLDEMMSNYCSAEFDGYNVLGNNRITLAGTIDYNLNTEENIIEAKLVCGDKIIDIANKKKNIVKVECSFDVEEYILDYDSEDEEQEDNQNAQMAVYILLKTESGNEIKISPSLDCYGSYKSVIGKESDEEDSYVSFVQKSQTMITTKNGEKYVIENYDEEWEYDDDDENVMIY